MHRAPLAFAALVLLVSTPMLACLQQVGTGNTGDDSSSGVVATATATPTTAASGSGCSTNPSTGITLCQQVSTCPGVVVDQGALSGCGFRVNGTELDLECLCGNALCPIGAPATCTQASQLLSSTTSFTVCQAAGTSCTQLTTTTAPAASSTGTSTSPTGPGTSSTGPGTSSTGTSTSSTGWSSSCNQTCETECAGEPDCILLCGC